MLVRSAKVFNHLKVSSVYHTRHSNQLLAFIPALLSSFWIRGIASNADSDKWPHLNSVPHHSTKPVHHSFGSKTAYLIGAHDHHGPINHDLLINWEDLVPSVAEGLTQCSLIHINAIIRHGTRAPSDKDLKKVRRALDRLLGLSERITHDHIRTSITSWRSRFALEKEILSNGIKEMEFLGNNFANLLSSSLIANPNFLVEFRSSSSSRCVKSAQAFINQLKADLARNNPNKIELIDKVEVNDTLIRFFDTCQRYIDEVDDNPASKYEFERLKQAPLAQEWISKWHERLNLPPDTLSFTEVLAIWKVTGIELAEFQHSHLHPLLEHDDTKFLEFMDDVEEYWQKLYGYPINYEMSYPLLAEMVGRFHEVTSHPDARPHAVFSFAHAETILPVIASFGLFRDSKHLGADTIHEHLHERRFRSSRVVPFAANIAFLMYNCTSEQNPNPQYRLQVVVNGKPVAMSIKPKSVGDSSKIDLEEDIFSNYHMYPIEDVTLHLAESLILQSRDHCGTTPSTAATAYSFPLFVSLLFPPSTELIASSPYMVAFTTVLSMWGVYRLLMRYRR